MKRILGVVRASTEHQEIVSQKNELRTYIQSMGYKADEIEWIETAGASARKANSKYLDMLQSIKDAITSNETIKACAFWHLNRLGRVDTYFISMKNWFIDNKIQVFVKNPSLSLLNEDGSVNAGAEIAWGVFATMVKQETSEMFEKMKRGKERNANNGIFNGGNVGIGYRVNKTTRKVETNEEEVQLLTMIFEEYTTNRLSTYNLAKELNERGITQRGRKITAQWLQRILATEAMKDIVGVVLYNKAKTITKSRNVCRKNKHVHISGGLIKCPYCGGNMYAETKGYKCYNHYNQHRNETSIYCANTAKLNTTLIDNLAFDVAIIGYVDYVAANTKQQAKDYTKEITINKQKIAEFTRKAERIENKQERIKTLFINGDISTDEYNRMKEQTAIEGNEVKRNKRILTRRNEDLQKKIEAWKEIEKHEGDSIYEAFENAETFDLAEARNITQKFIKHIEFIKERNGKYQITITAINNQQRIFNYYAYNKDGRVLKEYNTEDGNETDYMLRKRFEGDEVVKGEEYISITW